VRNLLDDVVGVVVAVGAREDEDAEFHTFRVTKRCVFGRSCGVLHYDALLAVLTLSPSERCLITCRIEL
jgi:hypothetical protein